jgi:hypothetical protein
MYCFTVFSTYVNVGASAVVLKINACYVLRVLVYLSKRFPKIILFPR